MAWTGVWQRTKQWLGLAAPGAANADRDAGGAGEAAAARFLEGLKYTILQRNLRDLVGEIDLVACAPDGKTIVLVEVKTALVAKPVILPEFRVGARKQRKLTALGYRLIRKYKWHDRPVRFDVIGVTLRAGQALEIRHYVSAFAAKW